MFIGSEGLHISSAVRLGSRWSPLCQCYCVNAHVRGHTFTNNMNIFLDNTQLHWIQWIYLINPIISFEWGISVPTGLLLFDWDWRLCARLPGCQPKRLVPFSRRLLWPCGVRANLWLWRGDRECAGKKKGKERKKTHTHTDRNTNTSAHITKQEYTHILKNALVTLM